MFLFALPPDLTGFENLSGLKSTTKPALVQLCFMFYKPPKQIEIIFIFFK